MAYSVHLSILETGLSAYYDAMEASEALRLVRVVSPLQNLLTVTDFGGVAVFAGFQSPRFRYRSRNSLWPSKLYAPFFVSRHLFEQSLLPFPMLVKRHRSRRKAVFCRGISRTAPKISDGQAFPVKQWDRRNHPKSPTSNHLSYSHEGPYAALMDQVLNL